MLEKADLKRQMTKQEYKQDSAGLKAHLSTLQQTIKQQKLPVIVLFEGWSAAGKGSMISDLILTLDPRGFKVYSIVAPDQAEQRKPLLWRYWNKIPEQGSFSIFDRSWYQDVSLAQVEQELSDQEIDRRIRSINTFERQLSDDGYLIIKFFLHISQKEQKERLDKLSDSKNTSWRVNDQDRKRNKQYDRYYRAADAMLERTNTRSAPWHVIASQDKYSAMSEIYHVMVSSIVSALEHREKKKKVQPQLEKLEGGLLIPEQAQLLPMPKLREVSLDKSLSDEKYDELLEKAQKKLKKLHNKLYREKIPVVIAYEGWDAAGKGGNIRRVAAALDPRGYEVVPVAAPSKTELAHHYLWRFWNNLPKTGHIAIFDRSWYGRVMVERIEGFCSQEDWKRAYQEINEFERELYDWGAVVIKFWLHIDQEEQLKRFQDRQNTPSKQWKITDEDWRNREKWDQYEEAVDEMLQRTSTDYAPWYIIQSQDKKYARVQALQLLIENLEKRLER